MEATAVSLEVVKDYPIAKAIRTISYRQADFEKVLITINQSHNARRGGRGQGGSGDRGNGGRGNSTINGYSVEVKMKDGPLSKLTITEGRQQATQYKKLLLLY